jgi:hypothetical protein
MTSSNEEQKEAGITGLFDLVPEGFADYVYEDAKRKMFFNETRQRWWLNIELDTSRLEEEFGIYNGNIIESTGYRVVGLPQLPEGGQLDPPTQ